ncbi:MAG: DUF2284 domain-containing protein [Thermoplasmata archaeon]|nr:DUF2284 domain-containing protein [Thermoplasmata archaeon]
MRVIYEKEISTKSIIVSPRPVWKCLTCEFYGKRPSCPPHAPHWKEAKDWVRSYKKALLIKFEVDMKNFDNEKRDVLLYLLHRERELFSEYPYVFALFPGACNLCDECEFEKSGRCSLRDKVRPSIDAVGIEITSITEINYYENVLYGLIFLD